MKYVTKNVIETNNETKWTAFHVLRNKAKRDRLRHTFSYESKFGARFCVWVSLWICFLLFVNLWMNSLRLSLEVFMSANLYTCVYVHVIYMYTYNCVCEYQTCRPFKGRIYDWDHDHRWWSARSRLAFITKGIQLEPNTTRPVSVFFYE